MSESQLIPKLTAYVEAYMNNFDASHDFNHIKRVLGNARQILFEIEATLSTDNESAVLKPKYDRTIITLATLLHDVGDGKYLKEGEDGKTMVRDLLLSFDASQELADKVQTICLGVSYSPEIKDRPYVERLIERCPELAVVQDADRLDAIGAVGMGRVFTYGAARMGRDMAGSLDILDSKLFKLEAMMKTGPGRRLARERTERLEVFKEWWEEEVKAGNVDVLG